MCSFSLNPGGGGELGAGLREHSSGGLCRCAEVKLMGKEEFVTY